MDRETEDTEEKTALERRAVARAQTVRRVLYTAFLGHGLPLSGTVMDHWPVGEVYPCPWNGHSRRPAARRVVGYGYSPGQRISSGKKPGFFRTTTCADT
jgi:hypothetical protein